MLDFHEEGLPVTFVNGRFEVLSVLNPRLIIWRKENR
jgi:hypothetical protein